jgi:predicted MFS family arabinose efflux permease
VSRKVDVPGIAAITIGLTALVLGLVESNRWGWGSGRIVGLFAVAAVALVAFVVIETRTRVPMVDFSFFRSRSFLGANLVAFVVSFAMLAMFFFIALYMQNILGYSPLQAGIRFLPSTLCVMVVGPIAGRLTDKLGPRNLIVAGLVLVAASLAWQSRLGVHTSYGFLLPGFVAMGIGIALVMSPMSTAAMNAVHVTKAGVASGVLSMSRMVGGTFGVAAMGALVAALGRSKLDALLPGLPAARREAMVNALGGGGGTGRTAGPVADAMREAYVYAVGRGLLVAAGMALLGAVAAFALVAREPAEELPPPEAAATEAVREPVGV